MGFFFPKDFFKIGKFLNKKILNFGKITSLYASQNLFLSPFLFLFPKVCKGIKKSLQKSGKIAEHN